MAKRKISADRPRELEVRNMGEPVVLSEINLAGVSSHSARGGEQVDIITRLLLTSDQAFFHRIVVNLAAAMERSARADGSHVRLDRAGMILLVIKPDNSGELWVDAAATSMSTALKRPGPLSAGTVLFENDIADVTGIWFPHVKVGLKDRVVCLFREGWRFGLFFDFNPDGELAIEDAKRDLAALYRRLRYADLYAAFENRQAFPALIQAGWFPFLELMKDEFLSFVQAQEAGFELDDCERELLTKFDEARIDRMFDRWMERPLLRTKQLILEPAKKAFKAKEPVSVIKIVLSEIEGVMSDAHFEATGGRTHRIDKLCAFMIAQAEQRAGGKDTLFFPVQFGEYLRDYIYSGFRPGDSGRAGSRHAVGHGAVSGEEYTMTRALQALLTLDQLAFYM
ncbi:hypothetical protein [Novosphingobium sp.]|uniref:hypothetical protein n=1 Tax=Novosphingobium sp. TaxID=1874826 RepID=UPI0027336C67|nr:hypothetical protein [Novosphingobium sp.]MDP3906755.1 hypothetical protein [Novosphingobium sp.]